MTAEKELNSWLAQLQKVKTETDREAFVQSFQNSILNKSTTELREGLVALKESISDFNKEVDQKINLNKIQIYPSSEEEVEFLKSLFSKMNIRFDLG